MFGQIMDPSLSQKLCAIGLQLPDRRLLTSRLGALGKMDTARDSTQSDEMNF